MYNKLCLPVVVIDGILHDEPVGLVLLVEDCRGQLVPAIMQNMKHPTKENKENDINKTSTIRIRCNQ